jgi:hypothetical protein
MEKKLLTIEIIHHTKETDLNADGKPYTWGEIKTILEMNNIVLEDTHRLEICFIDDCWEFYLYKDRLETDKEFQERKEKVEFYKKINDNVKYKQYLKLKEEFENNI